MYIPPIKSGTGEKGIDLIAPPHVSDLKEILNPPACFQVRLTPESESGVPTCAKLLAKLKNLLDSTSRCLSSSLFFSTH